MTPADNAELLLPEGTRLLHIGPQKTGSTALQAAIYSQKELLQQHGVTAIGVNRAERKALWAALMHHDSADERYRRDFARWDAMVQTVGQAEGRVLISNESLGKADRADARRVVDALGGERVHLVAVARRLDRLLPSQWQQRVKMNATTLSYEEWLQVVLGDDRSDLAWRNIWVPHDLASFVARWVEAASPDRFTLVIADETDRRMLSRTVETMLDLPEGTLRPQEVHKTNQSLSYGRLELVRMLNEQLVVGEARETAAAAIPRRVARMVRLGKPWPGEQRLPELPGWARERVALLSDERAKLVSTLPVRVVGDPENLRLPAAAGDGVGGDVGLVSAELAAHTVIEALNARDRDKRALESRDKEIRRLRRRIARLKAGQLDHLPTRELIRELGARTRRRLPF
jgi:hypothetical protein